VRSDLVATPFQTVGPFFHLGLLPSAVAGPHMSESTSAFSLLVSVKDGDGVPVPDAWLEVWDGEAVEASAVGRQGTDADGRCVFEIARACRYLNICVFARGLLRYVVTRAYFVPEAALVDDPVAVLVAPDRRPTLLARAAQDGSRRWWFDIRLQGDGETVFFDM
jgi:protocatechuate 3,4-dioxygenase alpha subunit